MLKNYLKIAFRNLLRDRSFSILNLLGLAIGLASVIMILGYVRYELSYDKSYSNHTRLYRLLQENPPGSVDELTPIVSVHMAEVLKKEFPAIEACSTSGKTEVEFKYKGNIVSFTAIDGDPDLLKMFNYEFVKGDAASALKDPGSLVLTESLAAKYFPGQDPMGQVITDKDKKKRHVTGVIKDIPANTHLSGEAVVSQDWKDTEAFHVNGGSANVQYVLLNKNADPKKLDAQFSTVYKKYNFPPGTGVRLQPVTDIHLRSHYFGEQPGNSDIKYIYIFSSIALLILCIACINYVNLTTARSMHRAREIGLRKVLGALRKQLIAQFLTESFLFFAVSTLLAVVIAYALWPTFSARITGYSTTIPLFDSGSIILLLVLLVIGGLVAGAYPAFFLSSLQPVKVLKGIAKFGLNISLRKGLVVVQFVISGVLIIGTLVVTRQLNYIRNADLGFKKDNLLEIRVGNQLPKMKAFKEQLLLNKDVLSTSVSSWVIGHTYGGYKKVQDPSDTTKQIRTSSVEVEYDFLKTTDIRLVAGRFFSPAYGLDKISPDSAWRVSKDMPDEEEDLYRSGMPMVVNQAAVKLLGLKGDVIGQVITTKHRGTIVGVIDDFNGMSMHDKIEPVFLYSWPDLAQGALFVKISSKNTHQTIAYIRSQWKKFYPDYKLDLKFADDKLQELYTADVRLGSLFTIFSSLAIVIACLGLFGLISLTVQNRVKEIGIRKVLGASVASITALISADLLKLVLLSFIISSPIAWYFMDKWLQDFAYRINIEWWIFAVACAVTILIAFVTLSFRSIKAAMANPVDSLRSE
ncbi:ABC transporter permease [Mucilaginibacter myungsuensis]|uniref:ABC transporter permease n=1 Tax=Mucilaginibacter myungsuensis TaxID=649104 RepID=A0A929PV09_9SPHI|nr:ABC transporter permease [Mucilaginibacter myungsuensis]MBE9660649.1 ABC transporter permease [Mucilaginibacter myungsuensis]MDN3600694.1 ABC transporter permease [Mucilaginibacter myungsuensis]